MKASLAVMTMLKEAYSSKELAVLLCVTERSIVRRASREAWQARPRPGRGGGNEWLLASMPEATRLKLAAALAAEAGKLAQGSRKQPVNTMGQLAPTRRTRAEARVLAVQMARQFQHGGRLKRSAAYEIFAYKYNSGEIAAPDWAKAALPGLSRASLINWENTLQNEGPDGLAGKQGSHRKGNGAIDQPYINEFCLGHVYKYPHQGATKIYRDLQARLTLKNRPERLPSQRTVQLWHKAWREEHEEIFTFIANPDEWRNKFRVAFGDSSALVWALNQEWEMDSTPADLLLADGKRHTIVACIDLFTRRVTFHVSRTSSSHAVASCLRKAISKWGVPELVRTDNGQDYVSQHIRRVLTDMNIYHDVCAPFSPEQKPFVERVFRTFLHDNMELLNGFVGHNVAERKALEARKSFARRMMDKNDPQTIELRLSPEELQKVCDRWAGDTYMHRKHGKLGMTPYEKTLSWDGEVRRVQDENAMRLLFLPCVDGNGTRRVSKGGGINIFNDEYIAPELGLHIGKLVQVRVDDADQGLVYAYSLDSSEFICSAKGFKHSGMTQAERKAIALAARHLQNEQRSAGSAAMRKAAKAANLDEIAYEAMQADEIHARSIEAAQPLRAELMGIHSTPALEGAAEALKKPDYTPPPMSQAELETQKQARKAIQAARTEPAPIPAAELAKQRYLVALNLEEALKSGVGIAEDKHAWLTNYQTTPEYDTQSKLHQFYGESRLNALAG